MKNLFLLVFVIFVSCNSNLIDRKSDKPQIVCTTGIIADGIKYVYGNEVNVISLMGPGVDPHSYNPTSRDRKALKNADVIVANGLHLEGKMIEILDKSKKKVFYISDGVSNELLRKLSDAEDVYDPHIWFDPDLWLEGLKNVVDSINGCCLGLDIFTDSTFFMYSSSLMNASIKWSDSLMSIENAILVTSHDAFSYLGSHYGIEVNALQGISTVSEAGARDVVDLVDYIVNNKVKSIFFETSVPKERLEAVIQGVNVKGWNVRRGGMLYSDALGDTDGNTETLEKVYEHNLRTIYEGLR
jgi:manganese/zinc/iron transport system substrate-binding protein